MLGGVCRIQCLISDCYTYLDICVVALFFCQTKTPMVLLDIQYVSLLSLDASRGTK